ncbi:hypothetical protein FRC01_007766, partial [Tulasnella sp. 417]
SKTHIQGTSSSKTSTLSSDVHHRSAVSESTSIQSSNQAAHGGAIATNVSTTLASNDSSTPAVKSTEVVSATNTSTSVTAAEIESRDTSRQKTTEQAVVVSTSTGVQQVNTTTSTIGGTSTSVSTSSSIATSVLGSKTHVAEETALTTSSNHDHNVGNIAFIHHPPPSTHSPSTFTTICNGRIPFPILRLVNWPV